MSDIRSIGIGTFTEQRAIEIAQRNGIDSALAIAAMKIFEVLERRHADREFTEEDVVYCIAGSRDRIDYAFLIDGGIYIYQPDPCGFRVVKVYDDVLRRICIEYLRRSGREFGSFGDVHEYAIRHGWENPDSRDFWKEWETDDVEVDAEDA